MFVVISFGLFKSDFFIPVFTAVLYMLLHSAKNLLAQRDFARLFSCVLCMGRA